MPFPVPTPYPNAFSIEFVTNVTTASTTHNESFYNNNRVPNSEIKNMKKNRAKNQRNQQQRSSHHRNLLDPFAATEIGGKLYYDWGQRSQRIDHDAGSYECVHFYKTNLPCSLYFLPHGGMYRVIHHEDGRNEVNDDTEGDNPAKEGVDQVATSKGYQNTDRNQGGEAIPFSGIDCCLDLANIHTVPPDWASHIVNSTYNGIFWDEYSQLWAYQWSFDNIRADESPSVLNTTSTHSEAVLKQHRAEKGNSNPGETILLTQQGSSRNEMHIQSQKNTKPRFLRRQRSGLEIHARKQSSISLVSQSRPSKVYDYHTVREVAFGLDAGKPLVFTFPGAAMGRQDYHYNVKSLTIEPQDPSLFELPSECLDRACQ